MSQALCKIFDNVESTIWMFHMSEITMYSVDNVCAEMTENWANFLFLKCFQSLYFQRRQTLKKSKFQSGSQGVTESHFLSFIIVIVSNQNFFTNPFQSKPFYLRNISDISQAYLRHISGISQAYLRHISGIYHGYLSYFSAIFQAYRMGISGISHGYLRHIS